MTVGKKLMFKEIADIRYLWSVISRSGPCSLKRLPSLIIGLENSFLKGRGKGNIWMNGRTGLENWIEPMVWRI